jgi:hypothetical protein
MSIMCIWHHKADKGHTPALSILIHLQSPSDSPERLKRSSQNSQAVFRFFSCLNSFSKSDSSLEVHIAGAFFQAALLGSCLFGTFDVENDLCGWSLPRIARGGSSSNIERTFPASRICLQISLRNCDLSAHSIFGLSCECRSCEVLEERLFALRGDESFISK